MSGKNGTGYRTVKITEVSHGHLSELMDKVSRYGWASIGAERNDKLTQANVMDEAIRVLLERKAAKK